MFFVRSRALGRSEMLLRARLGCVTIMQHRNSSIGLSVPAPASGLANAKASALRRDYEYAQAEITRLKLELAQARDQLHQLEDATSDFVHLMI